MTFRRFALYVLVLCLLAVGHAPAAYAQPNAHPWEFEVHGGFATGTGAGGGSSQGLPPPGASFTTFNGLPSRLISSWYFGDGSTLRNEYFAGTFSSLRLTPLDPVLTAAGARRGGGGNVGVRLERRISPRLAVEFNLDLAQRSLQLTDDFLDGLEQTRAGFTLPWTGLVSGLIVNPRATSVATTDEPGGRQLLTTGALTWSFPSHGRVTPYVTGGAGMASHIGDNPGASLVGNYSFLIGGVAPINETDTVAVRLVPPGHSLVTLFGGGVKIAGSARWGIRGDVRAHLTTDAADILVSATPSTAALAPAGVLVLNSNGPALQFANSPVGTSIRSNLTGAPVRDFVTFEGGGVQVSTTVSFGYYVRF